MKPKLVPTSAFGYDVYLYGKMIGFVGKGDRFWIAKLNGKGLGEFRTRREAVEAMMASFLRTKSKRRAGPS